MCYVLCAMAVIIEVLVIEVLCPGLSAFLWMTYVLVSDSYLHHQSCMLCYVMYTGCSQNHEVGRKDHV